MRILAQEANIKDSLGDSSKKKFEGRDMIYFSRGNEPG